MNNLRKIATIVLCVELLILIGGFMNGSFQPATVLVSALSDLTNQERQQNNLAVLKVDSLLSKAAQMKAEDMAGNQYFSHVSPDGKTPWYWLELVGYKYDYAGENLAINFNESKEVTDAWMNSPTHRENLLKNSYTEMGTGIASGTYKGKEGIFIVQDYASPRVEKVSESENISNNIPTSTGTKVLGAMTQFANNTNTKKIVIIIVSVLIAITILFFLIRFTIKYSKKHPAFLNALLVILAIALGAYIIYQLVFKERTFMASSTNYSSEDAIIIPIESE
ncbi:MAG: CAP domain-containing protein [Candidatus Paceibacterota bacterium]|jgi:hypothetical protein